MPPKLPKSLPIKKAETKPPSRPGTSVASLPEKGHTKDAAARLNHKTTVPQPQPRQPPAQLQIKQNPPQKQLRQKTHTAPAPAPAPTPLIAAVTSGPKMGPMPSTPVRAPQAPTGALSSIPSGNSVQHVLGIQDTDSPRRRVLEAATQTSSSTRGRERKAATRAELERELAETESRLREIDRELAQGAWYGVGLVHAERQRTVVPVGVPAGIPARKVSPERGPKQDRRFGACEFCSSNKVFEDVETIKELRQELHDAKTREDTLRQALCDRAAACEIPRAATGSPICLPSPSRVPPCDLRLPCLPSPLTIPSPPFPVDPAGRTCTPFCVYG